MIGRAGASSPDTLSPESPPAVPLASENSDRSDAGLRTNTERRGGAPPPSASVHVGTHLDRSAPSEAAPGPDDLADDRRLGATVPLHGNDRAVATRLVGAQDQ